MRLEIKNFFPIIRPAFIKFFASFHKFNDFPFSLHQNIYSTGSLCDLLWKLYLNFLFCNYPSESEGFALKLCKNSTVVWKF